MAMVVECGSCGARFRLNEALLEDAAGARIRCRRCGGHIEVWKPGASPALPAPVTPCPATGEEPAEAEAGVPAFDLTATVPVPAPEPVFSREPREVDRNVLRRESRLSRRRRARSAVYLVAACVLLLLGGAFLLRDTPLGKALAEKLRNAVPVRELVRGFFPRPEPAKTAPPATPAAPVPAAEKPVYEFRGVKSYHVKKAFDGADLFVIQGTVANFGKARSPGIRIRAALLGKDNQVLASTAVFAGNHLDDTALRHASRAVIEGYLGVRYGDGNVNRDIPVGNSLPFMAVFFDPPQQFQSFDVNAQDAE